MKTLVAVYVVGIFVLLGVSQMSIGDVVALNPVGDTRISNISGDADVNYEGETPIQLHGGNVDAGLFQFDLSVIPAGSIVTSVTFAVYINSAAGGPYFEIRKLLESWTSSQATWNDAKTGVPWTTAGGYVSSVQLGNDDILAGDVGKYLVYPSNSDFVNGIQTWVDHAGLNYGLILRRGYGDTSQQITFPATESSSNRPILTVGYVSMSPSTEDTKISNLNGEADTNFEGAVSIQLHGGGDGTTPVDAGLFKFDMSSIYPGTVVTSVTFGIYIEDASGGPWFEFRELTRHWLASQATWNKAMDGYSWSSAGGDVSGVQLGNNDIVDAEIGGYQTYPSSSAFVNAVQGWIDNSDSNKGIILRRLYGDTGQYITYTTIEGDSAHRPLLTVNGKTIPWPPFGTVVTIR